MLKIQKGSNMIKFIKSYALEIFTVISMLLLLVGGLIGDLSVIQKIALVYIFLFVLHEWEEMKYPGGFADSIAKMLGVKMTDNMKHASRIPTSILLLTFTLTPLCLPEYPITILPIAWLGLFEGFVHIFTLHLFKSKNGYFPGLVTAELQAIFTIFVFSYFIRNNIMSCAEFLIGFVVMFACFVIMQKSLTLMIGYKYSDVFKAIKKQLAKK